MNKLTPKLAELIGAHVGDGTLYRTNTSIVWELRGDLKEKTYYTDHICPIIKSIFNIDIKSKFRSGGKNGVWGIQTSKKVITKAFISLGFSPGTKTYTVEVPDYIFKSNINIKRAFIRGLFDTDGCLNFFKINNNQKRTYPRIKFSFASEKLRNSLSELLKNVGFESYSWNYKGEYCLCLAGKQKLEKWMDEIKPMNPKCLKKHEMFKILGFYQGPILAGIA